MKAISLPLSALWAAGKVAISSRVNQGDRDLRLDGGAYSGTPKPRFDVLDASTTGS
jgi:hypothetical protein